MSADTRWDTAAWDALTASHTATTAAVRSGCDPTLVRIAHRLGLNIQPCPPLDPDRHLCSECDEHLIRPAVVLIRYHDSDGTVYEHGSCGDLAHLGAAILPVLSRLVCLAIPTGVILPGDPPLTHVLGCTSWPTNNVALCDCGPLHLADAPTMQAALVQTLGDTCDDLGDAS